MPPSRSTAAFAAARGRVLACCLFAAACGACGDEDAARERGVDAIARGHGKHDAAPMAPPRDAAAGDASAQPNDRLARGEYLVHHVSLCVECHSERLPSGAFDRKRLLAGVRDAFDLDPEDPTRGTMHTRNLTPDDETGLGEWSDDEIKNAFMHGMTRDGRVLHWTMPYWIYHLLTPQDADAIVAYLRALPPIRHELPERQPLPIEPAEAYHLPDHVVPRSTLDPALPEFEAAERGRYLASGAGLCIYCHTPPPDDGTDMPLDLDRLFAGRRKFAPVRLATPLLEPAPMIETRNLTPHATGLREWSPEDIANALRFGVSLNGLPVCDPMPSSFGGALRGLGERDALDIGTYLKTIPPQDSGEIRVCCSACHGDMDRDAGAL
jgi:hypothetical protein